MKEKLLVLLVTKVREKETLDPVPQEYFHASQGAHARMTETRNAGLLRSSQ